MNTISIVLIPLLQGVGDTEALLILLNFLLAGGSGAVVYKVIDWIKGVTGAKDGWAQLIVVAVSVLVAILQLFANSQFDGVEVSFANFIVIFGMVHATSVTVYKRLSKGD